MYIYLVCSGKYEQVGAGSLFDIRCQELTAGMQTRQGFQKGVRVTMDKGKAKALLVADMKVRHYVSLFLLLTLAVYCSALRFSQRKRRSTSTMIS